MREQETLLRVKEVADMFRVSVATIWNWKNSNPSFPKPRRISPNMTVWKLSELHEYIDNLEEA